MKNIYKKLRQSNGLSVVEIISICGIVLVLFSGVVLAARHYAEKSAMGNDSLAVKTAVDTATININDGGFYSDDNDNTDYSFPVKGYFDPIHHTIVKKRPQGYNDSSVVTTKNEKLFSSAPDTMVICVEYDGKEVTAYWTEGTK